MIYFPPSPPPSLTIFGYYHFIYNFLEFNYSGISTGE